MHELIGYQFYDLKGRLCEVYDVISSTDVIKDKYGNVVEVRPSNKQQVLYKIKCVTQYEKDRLPYGDRFVLGIERFRKLYPHGEVKKKG